MRNHYYATFYVDASGQICTARQTDQAGSKSTDNRTRNGTPVARIPGAWRGNQLKFKPFRTAAATAAALAAAREANP